MYLNLDPRHLLKIKIHKRPKISLIRLIFGKNQNPKPRYSSFISLYAYGFS